MDNFEEIDAYLNKELSNTQNIEVEKKILKDKIYAKELESHKLLLKATEALREDYLRKKITRIIDEEKSKFSQRLQISHKYRIAAGILFIISFFLYQNSRYTNSYVTEMVFEEKPQYSITVERSQSGTIQFEEYPIAILEERNKKEVEKAVLYFSSINREEDLYMKAQYNLAHAYLLQENFINAINIFEKLISLENIDNDIKQDAQFFLAVAYLNNNEIEKAKKYLEQILRTTNHKYSPKSKILLQKLKSFWRIIP